MRAIGPGTRRPGFYGVGEDGIQAFTDFGIENLIELVRMYEEDLAQALTADRPNNPISLRPMPDAYDEVQGWLR